MKTKSENRYRTIFNNSAVSLWEEDISDLRKAIKDLLPRSESELRAYLNEHPEFIAKAIDLIKVVDVNETTLELYEAPDKARLLGRLGSFADTSDPAVRASFAETILAIAAGGGRVLEGESTARTLRGRKLHISLKSYIPAETERYPHLLVSVIDITARKRAEEDLRAANRALRVRSECSKAIIQSAGESEMLERVCRVIAGPGGYHQAWAGYAEHDAKRSIRPVAQVGLKPGHLESLGLTYDDTERGRSPSGISIRTGRFSTMRDITTDPAISLWRREEALQCGYTSALALPLIIEGAVFGVLVIRAREPDAFDAAETELLCGLAEDVSFGIMTLRERSARHEAETKLNREHQLLLSIVNNLPDHIFFKDAQERYLFANTAKLEDMALSSLEDLVGRTAQDFFPPERAREILEGDVQVLRSKLIRKDVEVKRNSPKGRLEWRSRTYVPIIDETGTATGLVIISRDIRNAKLAEERLERSLSEKETLLRELQHRVKNNLSLVSSLLSLDMGKLADERSRNVFMNAQSRIRSMAAIYERLYRSADLGSVELHLYIQDLAAAIFAAYAIDAGRVRLTTSLAEVKLDLRRAVPLGLILNELISNALKYAFPGGRPGEIRLELAKNNGGDITVSVSDDGVGLPEGFDADSSESLGMKLVKLLADQIGGSFSTGRAAGNGALLAVKFKL